MDRDPVRAEFARLRWSAAALIVWLVLAVAGGGLATMALLYAPYDLDSSAYQMVLCVTAGAFGGALAALLSVVTLVSRGLELGDGTRRPVTGNGACFAARLAPMYAVRPLFGAAAGLIAYFLLLGLLLVVLSNGSDMTLEPMGLLSVTLLAGFFAQVFLERLRQMLDAFFGRGAPAPRAQGSGQPAPTPSTGPAQGPQEFHLQQGAAGDERG